MVVDAGPAARRRGNSRTALRDTAPRYSPDGRWLAFLRTEPKASRSCIVLPTDGGDARALTDLPGGAGAPRWSPDSTRIAFSTRVPDEGRYGRDEKITPDKEAPRRITGLQYRLDGVGFSIDHREQVFVVDLAATASRSSSPTATTTADDVPGARTARGWRSSRRAPRRPRARPATATSSSSVPTAPSCAR